MDGDKASRSVFVGNVPFDASESSIREIFEEIGRVVSFKLVSDRDTGKPKGFGFVEYSDQATAASAIRNLQNRDLNGRTLRIDSASQSGLAGGYQQQSFGLNIPPQQNRPIAAQGIIPGSGSNSLQPTAKVKEEQKYGETVLPKDAPEAISKVVASLPPEQMFELMKEMKTCIQNNPHEARNMLLQNPQLAYAFLQAQVVMRIVDPDIAMKMLHRQAPVQPLVSSGVSTRNLINQDKNKDKMSNRTKPQEKSSLSESAKSAMQNIRLSGTDQEKAQLIMEVMNLKPEQIEMLPTEQRQSIIELREQLQKSGALHNKK